MIRRTTRTLLRTIAIGVSVAGFLGACVARENNSPELVLRGTVAESSEVVSLDPVFLARQKTVEERIFADESTLNSELESNAIPMDADSMDENSKDVAGNAEGEVFDAPAEKEVPSKRPFLSRGEKLFAGTHIIWPVNGRVSSEFGMRRRHFHAGIDIAAPKGTPVVAVASGEVLTAKRRGAYGNVIIIGHLQDSQTLYGHLSGFRVREGSMVRAGQVIGFVGRSGRATGYHLHFETRVNGGIPQSPLSFLPGVQIPGGLSVSFVY